MEKDTILVPWDFTQVAEYALQHAIKISTHLKNRIQLIHVVKNEKLLEESHEKMEKTVEKLSGQYQIDLDPVVLHGSLFHVISDYASANNVSIVVMGTHGIKGMQKVTGSWALKVIVGSKIPFIVVQDPPSKKEIFKDVVFPLDYKKEGKQKVNWALFLAKFFDVKIHIIAPQLKDKGIQKKVRININFAEKIFENHGVNYDIQMIESSHVGEETIKYAQKIDADIVLIMTTKDIGFTDYMLGAKEQYIIANNAKLPVMCVNPRTDLSRYGGFSTTGG
jgi:nucleotide-binding universal stress UspA family protein